MSERAPEYPGYGKPCNGCGFCCAAQPCGLAEEFLGAKEGPCPAMEFADGRFRCGLVAHPSDYLGFPDFGNELVGGMIAEALGIGKGCDSEIAAPVPPEIER